MSVVYRQILKNTRMVAVQTDIDQGSGNSKLLIANTNGFANLTDILVGITFPDPASSVSSDVLTFLGTPLSNTAAFSGTATQAKIVAPGGTDVITGLTVGTSGTNIILNTTTITAGQLVRLDSGTITHG